MKPTKNLPKSPGLRYNSDHLTFTTLCTNDSETRSLGAKSAMLKHGDGLKSKYNNDLKKNELVRIKLVDKAKRTALNRPTSKSKKSNSIIHYRLFKQDYSEKDVHALQTKWCDVETTELDTPSFSCDTRRITVVYKCPELKGQLERYFSLLSKKLKWSKKLVYNYVISEISSDQIEVRSEVPITSLGPYLQILENPNLPLWEQLCHTIELDTGHSVGNVIVNIHLIKTR